MQMQNKWNYYEHIFIQYTAHYKYSSITLNKSHFEWADM